MADIYSQNFDSMTESDLNGQDSWNGATDFDVQTTVKQSGSKGVENVGSGTGTIKRAITETTTGYASVYIRVNDVSSAVATLKLYDDTVEKWGIGFFGNSTITFIHNGTNTVLDSSPSNDTFYLMELEFDCGGGTDNLARARIDGGAWSDWKECYHYSDDTAIDYIRFYTYSSAAKDKYYDEVLVADSAPTPPPAESSFVARPIIIS